MSGLTYLITGASRGIGKGLLSALVLRPNTTIIAAVRDISTGTASLKDVPKGPNSKIIIVKIDSTIDSDASAAAKELTTTYGTTHIDILISNAGLLDIIAPVLETPADQLRKHFEVNTIAPLTLLQAFKPLLNTSSAPKFFVISSIIGSIGAMEQVPVPFFAYGISKAAVNYLVRKAALENPTLTTLAFQPGWVQSDMGSGAAKKMGMVDAPNTLEESVRGLVNLFDGANLEKTGSFVAVGGETVPW